MLKPVFAKRNEYTDIRIITHGSDNDGVFAAWQMVKAFNVKAPVIFTEPGDELEKTINTTIDILTDCTSPTLLIITDLSIKYEDRRILEQLLDARQTIDMDFVFIDHHATSNWINDYGIINSPNHGYAGIRIDSAKCAAKLVNEELQNAYPDVEAYKIMSVIADVVNDRDMWIRSNPKSTQLELVTEWAGPDFALSMFDELDVYENDVEGVPYEDVIIPDMVSQIVRVLERKTQESIEAAVPKITSVDHPFCNLKIGAYISTGSVSDVCSHMIRQLGYDVIFCFMPTFSSMSIRSNDKFNVAKFAEWQGGGGHKAASGYPIKTTDTIEMLSHFEWLVKSAMFEYEHYLTTTEAFLDVLK